MNTIKAFGHYLAFLFYKAKAWILLQIIHLFALFNDEARRLYDISYEQYQDLRL